MHILMHSFTGEELICDDVRAAQSGRLATPELHQSLLHT